MNVRQLTGCQPTLAISNAQLASVLFVFIVLTASATVGGYVVGRSLMFAEFASLRTEEAELPPLVIDPAEQVVAKPPDSVAPVARLKQPPSPQASAPAVRPLYFQVGSLEKGMAEACKEYLTNLNFRVTIIPSTVDNFYRVLVGPLTDPMEISQTREALTTRGFRLYLRSL